MSKVSSQAKLAGKMGVHQNELSDIKIGKKHFSPKRAKKMAHFLKSDMTIWLSSATDTEIKKRSVVIAAWIDRRKVVCDHADKFCRKECYHSSPHTPSTLDSLKSCADAKAECIYIKTRMCKCN